MGGIMECGGPMG